jgi:hypothetical protein
LDITEWIDHYAAGVPITQCIGRRDSELLSLSGPGYLLICPSVVIQANLDIPLGNCLNNVHNSFAGLVVHLNAIVLAKAHDEFIGSQFLLDKRAPIAFTPMYFQTVNRLITPTFSTRRLFGDDHRMVDRILPRDYEPLSSSVSNRDWRDTDVDADGVDGRALTLGARRHTRVIFRAGKNLLRHALRPRVAALIGNPFVPKLTPLGADGLAHNRIGDDVAFDVFFCQLGQLDALPSYLGPLVV